MFAVSLGTTAYCPVSSAYDNSQAFHGYPMDIFFPEVQLNSSVAINCTIAVKSGIHLCNKDISLCPVTKHNVQSATSVATWPQYIDAIDRLGTKERINVFFLGGSMTHGSSTNAMCYCKLNEDSRCPPLLAPDTSEAYCSWISHIAGWMNRSFPASTFQFYDFTAGGRTSRSADYFVERVHKINASLSGTSLIFLDYSVNDAHSRSGAGLESMIRTIYANFGAHYQIVPTVVIVEQYPHSLPFSSDPVKLLKEMKTSRDYALDYRAIARHYHAVLISLREVYWTYFGDEEGRSFVNPNISQRHYPISPFEPHVHTCAHPPSYLHLYVADVLASALLYLKVRENHLRTSRTLPFVKVGTSATNTSVVAAPALTPSVISPTRTTVATTTATATPTTIATHTAFLVTLPPTLYDQDENMKYVCDLARPFAIDAVAHAAARWVPPNHTLGWEEIFDVHDPGWVVNSLSNPLKRNLTFPLIGDAAGMVGHMLKISYLASYEGRGIATVHICGRPVHEGPIDGLWAHKISTPKVFATHIDADTVSHCLAVAKDQRAVDIVYSVGDDKLMLRAVHKSQFKIFTVQVCSSVPSH